MIGLELPDVELPSSAGELINPKWVKGRAVYFCYPYTGRPGHPNPRGWDEIIGAHGSTPQALAYKALHQEYCSLSVRVFGLSLLSPEWITDFSERNSLPYDLVSDEAELFSAPLKLQRFTIDGKDYLRRITIVAMNGVITHVVDVPEPERDAAHILSLMP